MQITIVQSEIELAIKQYIHQQINVREGMEIEIDLKATRGEAGMQAIIDIVPASAKTAEPTPLNLVKKIAVAKEEPKAAPEVPFETEAKDAPEAESAEDTKTDDAAGEEAPAEGARQSLFGGLKRPVNA